jgi:hypothetical protein
MKALEVTISGSYKTEGSPRETIDFFDFKKTIPFVPEEKAMQQIRARYARMWIIKSDKFKKRPRVGRPSVYIDDMKEIENYKFGFEGKDIREMSIEDIQDLACAYDLNRIPLYQEADLRRMRTVAYVEYNNKILKNGELDEKEQGFNVLHYDPIIVKEAAKIEPKETWETLIPDEDGKLENDDPAPKSQDVDIDTLKKIADKLEIKYNPKVPHDVLYNKIYRQAS